jgi:hypothetical protein
MQFVSVFITLYLHPYAAWTNQGSATNIDLSARVIKLKIDKMSILLRHDSCEHLPPLGCMWVKMTYRILTFPPAEHDIN